MASLRGGDGPASLVGRNQLPAIGTLSLTDTPTTTIGPTDVSHVHNGRLRALKTRDEVRAELETFHAYVIQLQSRFASAIKDIIQQTIPDLKINDLQHLRRVAQWKYIPAHLQREFKHSRGGDRLVESPPDEDDAKYDDTVRYFLVAPIEAISQADLLDALRNVPPFSTSTTDPKIYTIEVPKYAPTSGEQADKWSTQYWPISYKNTNPYGPHPSLVTRTAGELEPEAEQWLTLAGEAADQMVALGFGESIGCVIVDNENGRGKGEVIAVAADCRWRSSSGESLPKNGTGNVMAHAVERAIAMVAKKRLRAAGKNPNVLDRQLFCDSPLTDLEKQYFELDNVPPTGYLCVGLDIYVTHEPCVMCSMAVLHSRFKRCVLGQRMLHTGGMTAETTPTVRAKTNDRPKGLGHGIFWRPNDLNWKLLVYEWVPEAANDKFILKPIPAISHA